MQCMTEGCDRDSVAKELCRKHYMRQRRTGDPNETRKPGRKPSSARAMLREIMGSDWRSERTFARYVAATNLLAYSPRKSG
jgi:hypothetical protein